jgi:MerR family transcriptional regulator, thiopeptide resistance regulator
MSEQPLQLRVGELAARTGLTVRTLHHYDELGLLAPGERTAAGHRRYGAAEVERLYRIVALRRIGLGLEEIGALLDGSRGDLESVLRRQLEALDARMARERRLRAALTAVLATVERAERPGIDDVLTAIEETERVERYYTPEQLAKLEERRGALGDDAIKAVEQAWSEIFARLRAAMEAGTDPAAPELDGLRTRMAELAEMFHGNDPGIKSSLQRMWAQEDPAKLSRGGLDAELAAYMQEVRLAAGSS